MEEEALRAVTGGGACLGAALPRAFEAGAGAGSTWRGDFPEPALLPGEGLEPFRV